MEPPETPRVLSGRYELSHLVATPHRTFCEWKGQAHYYTVIVADREAPDAVWSYGTPVERFAAIQGYLAFYPQRMDACFVDGERVQENEGGFYGLVKTRLFLSN